MIERGSRGGLPLFATIVVAGQFGFVASASAQEANILPAAASEQSPDQAQVRDGGSADIVVTARRKEESLQSVPLSVNVLGEATLQRQNVSSVYDLGRVSPGLTVTPSSGGSTRPAYQIRGQRAALTDIIVDPAVVVYFGEVAQGRPSGTAQSIWDLQSIQVLRGPQGTLFGRNTTGGAILMTPKTPKDYFEGYVRGATGNYDLRDLEGVINLPLAEGVAVRAGGKIIRRDGYFKDVLTGKSGWDENNDSLRLSLRIQPGSGITNDFVATYFRSRAVGFTEKLSYVLPNASAAYKDEVAAQNALGYYEFRDGRVPEQYDQVYSFQNSTTADLGHSPLFGDLTLKNIIAYRHTKNENDIYEGSALHIINTFGFYDGDQFSEEFQIQGSRGALDYILGYYHFEEKGSEIQQIVLPSGTNFRQYDATNTSDAVFLHADLKLSSLVEGLSASFGARYTHDRREVINRVRTIAAGPTYTCQATGTPVVIPSFDAPCGQTDVITFDEPTYDFSLNYQVSPRNLVYIAHRHGYRSGAARTLSPPVAPEYVDDIEIGSKNEFTLGRMRGRLNLAAYYSRYKDLQRQVTFIFNGGAIAGIQNAGRAHISGLEAEFHLEPVHNLEFNASYALTNAVYDEYRNVIAGVTYNNTSAVFSYTPKHMLNLGISYKLPLDDAGSDLSFALNYAYQSKFQAHDANSKDCGPTGGNTWCLQSVGMLPGYGLANARIDWHRPMGAPVDVGLFVTNLTDNKYLPGAFPLVNVLGIQSVWPGAPRMWGLELRVPFGGES
jgi:iron complex outermembrane receptor protein